MSNVNPTEGGSGDQAAVNAAYQQPTGSGTPAKKTAAKKTATSRDRTPASSHGGHHSGGHQTVAHVIASVADSLGVPPAVALALGMYESGLDPNKPGDGGTSFGIYQLHEGGELGAHTAQWAYNVENNAMTALSRVAQVHAEHPDWDWGRVAAAAQRPADQPAEAAAVNGYLAAYHNSGADNAVSYFTSQSATAGNNAALGSSHPKINDYLSSDVSSEFGYLSSYLDNPEVGPILRQAAKNQWSQQKLQAALEKTNWWQTTSQSARQAQALQSTDPASYRQTFAQQRAQVASLATSMGLHLGGDRLDKIATTAMWAGWTDLQLERSLSHEFNYNPDKAYKGTAGTTIQKLRSLSNQYLVPITDGQMQHWTRQVLAGSTTTDDFSGYLASQAKTLFPWMAKAIDAGTTPGQYLDPYRSAAASTLELDPAKVDFSQAKWRHLFETVDPKTGDRSERGLANAMTLMRTDPKYGYDLTQGANNDAANFAQGLAQEFGYVG